MEVVFLIVAIVVAFLFMRHRAERGKRFVRAYFYLHQINDGETAEAANGSANFMFSKYDTPDNKLFIGLAKSYAQTQYGGQKQPVVAEALAKGFRG